MSAQLGQVKRNIYVFVTESFSITLGEKRSACLKGFVFTYRPDKEARGGKQSQRLSLPGETTKGKIQHKIR